MIISPTNKPTHQLRPTYLATANTDLVGKVQLKPAWARLSKLLVEDLEAKGDLAAAANVSHELKVEF